MQVPGIISKGLQGKECVRDVLREQVARSVSCLNWLGCKTFIPRELLTSGNVFAFGVEWKSIIFLDFLTM